MPHRRRQDNKNASRVWRNWQPIAQYITRPAIANERLAVNRAGHVVLKLKTAWRDGTSHHVLTPMEFMQHLAAPAADHFHGVLASNARLRKAVVPVLPLTETTSAHAGGLKDKSDWMGTEPREVFERRSCKCTDGVQIRRVGPEYCQRC